MRRKLQVLTVLMIVGGITPHVFGQRSMPVVAEDPNAGFELIFDGESLAGWEGDSTYWRVENGALVGEITPETVIEENSFLIWQGGTPGDFELKAEYRITEDGNSGINYRSERMDDRPWGLRGYQADIDGSGRWAGQLYEEQGRRFLGLRGQMTEVRGGGEPPAIRASLGDSDSLLKFVNMNDWNEFQLIARGNVLIHIINGHVMTTVIDADEEGFRAEGLLGVQVHVGPPMKVEYRNIRLKSL